MGVVDESVEIAAPVADVFAYVDDFENAQEWLFGLTRFEPAGSEVQRGLGARYDGTMKVGVALKSTVECTAWEENRLIEMTSIKGITNTQRWSFEPLGHDRCRVHARITYELPGGPAAKAIEKAVNPVVGLAVQKTTENLVNKFEG